MKKLLFCTLLVLFVSLPNAVLSAENTTVRWLGHAGFEITTPRGNVILIDPWLKNPKAPDGGFTVEKADFVLVTHGHFDHFGETSEIIQATGAELVAIYELGMVAVNKKNVPKEKATMRTLLNIGGKISVLNGEVEIAMVQAIHSSGVNHQQGEGQDMLYGGNPVGYVISIVDGPTIYHTGDTALFGDMRLIRRLYNPNLMLLPIGDHFTMGPAQAAHAIKMVAPRWVIPMHYGTFPILTGTPEKLVFEMEKLRLKAEVVILEPGGSRKF